MRLRRVHEFAASIFMALGSLSSAFATPVPANELPKEMLIACDQNAKPFGEYADAIVDAVNDLVAIGAFSADEFEGVKIGFCGLRRAGGPAATTSCAEDLILMDSGYAAHDRRLVRNATLAHEMKHVFQHRALIAKHGDGYCGSERYAADWEWMEREADTFGDGVAELFFAGRAVEIKNECSVPVSIYLEADHPMAVAGERPVFLEAPAHGAIGSPERSTSKSFKVFAATVSEANQKIIRGGSAMANKRVVGGNTYGLESVALANADRSTGPFQMTLSCGQN